MANDTITKDSPQSGGGGSSTEFENPWESAANDRLWNEGRPLTGGEENTVANNTSGLNPNWMSSDATSSRTTPRTTAEITSSSSSGPPPSWCFQCFQACHWLDIVMGCFVILYVSWWSNEAPTPKGETSAEEKHHMLQMHRAWSIVLLLFGALWVLRGVLAKITPCGVDVSAKLSLAFAVIYGIWGLVGWVALQFGNPVNVLSWFWPPFSWCRSNPAVFPCLLWAFALLEAIRFFWIRRWIQEEQAADAAAYARSNPSLLMEYSSPTNENGSRQQPWWWRNDGSNSGGRGEPLLSPSRRGRPHWSSGGSTNYYMDDGITTNNSNSSWWPFSRRRTDNSRDDASVEYASLNEDWASRSEEDPFWWTQEDGAAANS